MRIRDRIKSLRRVKASELAPNPKNWRTHPKAQREAMQGLLAEIGFAGAALARQTPEGLELIDGHLRSELAPDAKIPVLVLDVTAEEADKILATFDPVGKMAEASQERLGALLKEIETNSEPLQAMLDALAIEAGTEPAAAAETRDPEPQIDRAAQLQKQWKTKRGQVWEIPGKAGVHRVMCGDCREAAHVGRLCVEKVNGCFTSPPYAEQRKAQYGGIPAAEYVEWWEAVQASVRSVLAEDGSFFVNIKPHCEDGERVLYVFDLVLAMKRRWGWRFVDELCWTKNPMPGVFGPRLKNAFEPLFHFAGNGAPKTRFDAVRHESITPTTVYSPDSLPNRQGGSAPKERKTYDTALPSNVLFVDAPSGTQLSGHAAAFPVGLPSFFIQAFSDPGDRWLDPFLGSGTTLIAAEQLGRVCYGMEIEPKYVAVILERAKDAGLAPVLAAS